MPGLVPPRRDRQRAGEDGTGARMLARGHQGPAQPGPGARRERIEVGGPLQGGDRRGQVAQLDEEPPRRARAPASPGPSAKARSTSSRAPSKSSRNPDRICARTA